MLRLIPMFYPMPCECGRQGKTLPPQALRQESPRSEAATSEAGASGASSSDKSPRGVTAARPYNPELPRGVLDLVTGGIGRMCMRSASRANSGDEELNLERRQRSPGHRGIRIAWPVSVIGDGAELRPT